MGLAPYVRGDPVVEGEHGAVLGGRLGRLAEVGEGLAQVEMDLARLLVPAAGVELAAYGAQRVGRLLPVPLAEMDERHRVDGGQKGEVPYVGRDPVAMTGIREGFQDALVGLDRRPGPARPAQHPDHPA